MGSNIPLPALAVQPPQPSDPIGAYGKLLSLRSLLQGQQMQQEQIQGAQLENQQRQQKVKDQQTVTQLYVKNNGDLDKTITDAAQAGVTPETLQALQLHSIDVKGKTLDLVTKQGTLAKQQADLMQGAHDTVSAAPAEQRPQVYQQQLAGLKQSGLDVSQMPPQYPGDEAFKFLGAVVQGHAQQIDQAFKQAETRKTATDALLNQNKLDVINSWKQNPQQVLAQVDSIVPPTGANAALNARTKSQVQFALGSGDVEGAKAAIKAAAEQVGAIEKETNPAVQAAKLHLATATKAAEQAITDGDPKAAAQLLIDGTVAPSQIISSRKPAFAQQAFSAAAQMQPGWNAQKADADFKVASSPSNVAFFGSAKSLTDKGGTLDQLADAAKDIPGGRIPVFNSIADAMRASTGSGPIAKYASILLGVSDDYSKVMGGGQGSDSSRTQALKLAPANASPAARAAAIEGIRGAVMSQINSRIGSNAVLQKMYGGGQTAKASGPPPPGATHTAPGSDGQMHYTNAQGQDLGVVTTQ